MRKRVLSFLALAAALVCGSSAWATPPVWIVRDADSEMILFGSVHVLPPGLTWRPDVLNKALQIADDIWFEIPVDPVAAAQVGQLAVAMGRLPSGKTLQALLTPGERARLAKVCKRIGLSPAQIDPFEPWFAEVLLATADFQAAGASASSGVEETLSSAVSTRTEKRSLETAKQQLDMFDQAPMADQVASLRDTLRQMDSDPKAYDRLVAAWAKGDVRRLDREALSPLRVSAPGIYRRLVSDRNQAWIGPLNTRLQGHGLTIVVVGVGHLIGPGGVPARLRALGYSVQGP
ncbi:MAG: TraB/GumN family protein [Alphaproteobacteria bacterium]